MEADGAFAFAALAIQMIVAYYFVLKDLQDVEQHATSLFNNQ